MTTATHTEHYNASAPMLFLAFELSDKTWKLGFTVDLGWPGFLLAATRTNG